MTEMTEMTEWAEDASQAALVSNFLTPANPDLDIRIALPRKPGPIIQADLVRPDIRELLITQPPLGQGERLPLFLALGPGELAVSTSKRHKYTYVQELNLYIPERHRSVLQLIFQEIADTRLHGAPQARALQENCNGPLCRQCRREARLQTARIRRRRLGYVSGSRQIPRQRDIRTKTVPQYAAVDPLLTAFTILQFRAHQHEVQPPFTAEQKVYTTLRTLRHVTNYLKQQYDTVA